VDRRGGFPSTSTIALLGAVFVIVGIAAFVKRSVGGGVGCLVLAVICFAWAYVRIRDSEDED
jgi:hypothetical protein